MILKLNTTGFVFPYITLDMLVDLIVPLSRSKPSVVYPGVNPNASEETRGIADKKSLST